MFKNRSKQRIRILYKSGNTRSFWVYNFKITHKDGKLLSVSYDEVNEDNIPLHIGINDIESIWIVDRRNTWADFNIRR